MRQLACALVFCMAISAFGKTLSAPALPPPVFADLSASAPDWIYNGNWNLMRLTARGVDVQDEQFEVSVRNAAFVINLR